MTWRDRARPPAATDVGHGLTTGVTRKEQAGSGAGHGQSGSDRGAELKHLVNGSLSWSFQDAFEVIDAVISIKGAEER